jgi:uncharacterized protein YbjT (DUF2867 family)
MLSTRRSVLLPLLLLLAAPALAQSPKTTEAQPMAAPGESTEPPKPRASPIGVVEAVALPRSGSVLVFGGTSGTGFEAVKALVAMKEQVTVVTHGNADNSTLKAMGVTVVSGDAMKPETLKEVFKATPYRVVISTIGKRKDEPNPDFEGNKNIIDAAKAIGIPRFILVTMIGDGDSEKALPWFIRLFFKEAMINKTLAEGYLRDSGLEYTVIRPGALLNKPSSGKAVLMADPMKYSAIARVDLGKLIADCVKDDKTIKKVYTAYDASRASFFAPIFGD